jgi:hypothetical protein
MMEEQRSEAQLLAGVAQRQLGLATTEQLVEVGLSRETVRRRVASGALVRVGLHVYAVAGSPRSWEQLALAACLDRGRDAVLSHLSAARALRLDAPDDAAIHVTVPYGRRSTASRRGVVLHRTRALDRSDCKRQGPLSVTSVTRTLIDLATVLGPGLLARAVDDALSRRLVTPASLREASDLVAARRRGGTRALSQVLDLWCNGPQVESVAEARFLRVVAGACLPPPERQPVLSDADGVIGRVDFAWSARRVVLEVNGFRYHANPRSYAADSERVNRLAAAGWTVLHATPAELETSPRALLAALERHLAAPA